MIAIEAMRAEHWPSVRRIYEEGIATGQATFEQQAPEWTAWDASHLPHSRWIALIENEVVGWTALTKASDRCCYSGVAEVSYYVAAGTRGQGVGKALLQRVLASSEENGLWTITAGVFPENTASARLLERCGFRLVGRRERIGKMNGVWRDTLIWERRSSNVGI